MNAALSLSFRRLLPHPLRGEPGAGTSEIWQRDIYWKGGGERIFIQAPSGTGKTSLLHVLYGLQADYDGQVGWGSDTLQDLDKERLSLLRRNGVSMIFQDLRLFPGLTAWENLEIKRALTDSVPPEIARSWMDRLGISGRADQPAVTLSYGEQQRLSIIRGLLQPFSWLLMDEPFSHLDADNTVIAARLIEEVAARQGASLILADLDDNAHFNYTQKLKL